MAIGNQQSAIGNPVSVGIVGLGFMAATHLKAYRQIDGYRIAAICNPSGRNLDGDFSGVMGNIGSNEPLKLDMSQVKAYRSFADMLADQSVQLVDICAPTHTHPELAVTALKAGKHVLCEKPVARTAKLARGIADAAATATGFFMPAMCLRFWPEWRWLKRAMDQAVYGKILGARFRRVAQPPAWGQRFFFDGKLSGGSKQVVQMIWGGVFDRFLQSQRCDRSRGHPVSSRLRRLRLRRGQLGHDRRLWLQHVLHCHLRACHRGL